MHTTQSHFILIVFRTLWAISTSFWMGNASYVWALVKGVKMRAVRKVIAGFVIFRQVRLHLKIKSIRSIIRRHRL